MEKIRQSILMHIARELNIGLVGALFLHGLYIAGSLGMVASANDQSGVWQGLRDRLKCIDHELEPFVSSPFTEGQNAMLGIAAPRKIRAFRFSGQDSMGTKMHVVMTIFFVEDLTIAGHEHRHRIRQQEHSGGHSASQTVGMRVSNPGVLQVDGVHQVMQGDVGITATQSGKKWSE